MLNGGFNVYYRSLPTVALSEVTPFGDTYFSIGYLLFQWMDVSY